MIQFIAGASLLVCVVSILWLVISLVRRKPWKPIVKIIIGSFLIAAVLGPDYSNANKSTKANNQVTQEKAVDQADNQRKQVVEWVNKVDYSLLLITNNIKNFQTITNGNKNNNAALYSDIETLKDRIWKIDTEISPPKFVDSKQKDEFEKALNTLKDGLGYRRESYSKMLDYIDSKKPSELSSAKEYMDKSIVCIDPSVKIIETIKTDIANKYK